MATYFLTPFWRAVLHRERAHHQVVVEEAAGILAVRADAADDRGEVDDDVRAMVVEETADIGFARQVVVLLARDDELRTPSCLKRGHDVRAEKAGAAGDGDALVSKIQHGEFSMARGA